MTGQQKKTFLHFSDAHIGHRQYGLKKRLDDMYMTLKTTISGNLDKIDFAVFGGDLFHNKNVQARTLSDAEKCLNQFKKHEIPIVGVEGNHDKNLYKQGDLSWLEYLHNKRKLILLEANLEEEEKTFCKHDFNNPGKSSGYVEIGGVRIFGLQYQGQRTKKYLSQVAEGIKEVNQEQGRAEKTILIGHFGIEGHIAGMSGGVSVNALEPLEELIDYLALGHIHKNYSHGEWIFNPGSLESHNTRQGQWDLGYYMVNETDNGFSAEFENSKRRPVFRFKFEVDEFDNPEELRAGFKRKVETEITRLRNKQEQDYFRAGDDLRDPIIDLRLDGLLQFSRSRLDIELIKEIIIEKLDALTVRVNDATESKETASILQEFENSEESIRNEDGQLDRNKLEKAIFYKLTKQDKRYSKEKEGVVEALSAVKNSALDKEDPESIAEVIKNRRRQLFSNKGEE